MTSGEPVVGMRAAAPGDSEFCHGLHRAAMRDTVEAIWGWDEAVQRGFHERGFDPSRISIVTVDGCDAGMIAVDRHPGELYLARIELHPEHQGRGIGSRLIRDLLAEASGRGQPMTLDVLVANERARALYHRLGFREVDRHGPDNIKIRMRADGGGR